MNICSNTNFSQYWACSPNTFQNFKTWKSKIAPQHPNNPISHCFTSNVNCMWGVCTHVLCNNWLKAPMALDTVSYLGYTLKNCASRRHGHCRLSDSCGNFPSLTQRVLQVQLLNLIPLWRLPSLVGIRTSRISSIWVCLWYANFPTSFSFATFMTSKSWRPALGLKQILQCIARPDSVYCNGLCHVEMSCCSAWRLFLKTVMVVVCGRHLALFEFDFSFSVFLFRVFVCVS